MSKPHMKERLLLPLSLAVIFLCAAVSGCRSHEGSAAATASVAASPQIAKNEPSALVQQGRLIFDETPKYAHSYVGNKLACSDCHIKSGTADYAAPMIDMSGLFPMFSKRAGHVISLQNRIQECFARSESGQPLPADSAEMQALVAYIDWLSKDGVKGRSYKGRGLVKLAALTGNPVAGKAVYAAKCAACHGSNGAGVPPVFPPLWGKDSYNDGAGMNNPAKSAAYVFQNMPQNQPRALTPQQAYDVSVYIHSKPRPKFDQAYKGY